MSNLSDLVQIILSEAQSAPVDNRTPMDTLLLQAINKAMEEIRSGADPEDFADLAVVDLIFSAEKNGYSTAEIRDFVEHLKE